MNIVLRSQDRSQGETHNFKIRSERILQGLYHVKNISLANTFYNVTSENNEIVYNGVSLFVPEGNYNNNTITDIIKTLLDGELLDVFTVTVSKTTSKLTISSDTSTNFILTFPNGFNNVIGFNENGYIGDSTYTGFKVVQTNSLLSVGIDILESSYLNVANYTDDTKGSSIYLPFNEGYATYTIYKDDDLRQYVKFEKPVRTLTLQIKDLSTNEILNNHGAEWEVLFRRIHSDNPRLN